MKFGELSEGLIIDNLIFVNFKNNSYFSLNAKECKDLSNVKENFDSNFYSIIDEFVSSYSLASENNKLRVNHRNMQTIDYIREEYRFGCVILSPYNNNITFIDKEEYNKLFTIAKNKFH